MNGASRGLASRAECSPGPCGVLPDDPIIQQEYQKSLGLHGIGPDIIVHIPFERGLSERRDEGNFVAIELKRRATDKRARDAFSSLSKMRKALKYPLTVFINIDSKETHANLCPKSIADQTVCFAVRLHDGKPVVKAEQPRSGQRNVFFEQRQCWSDLAGHRMGTGLCR